MVEQNVQEVVSGVVSADYPVWVATEVVVFGGLGLTFIVLTYEIVRRRRPF